MPALNTDGTIKRNSKANFTQIKSWNNLVLRKYRKRPSTYTKSSCSGLTGLSCKQTPSLTSRSVHPFETTCSKMSYTRGPRGQPGSRICAFLTSCAFTRGTYPYNIMWVTHLTFVCPGDSHLRVYRWSVFKPKQISIIVLKTNMYIYLFIYNLHGQTINVHKLRVKSTRNKTN